MSLQRSGEKLIKIKLLIIWKKKRGGGGAGGGGDDWRSWLFLVSKCRTTVKEDDEPEDA